MDAPRFSLRTLLAAVAFIGLAITALVYPSPLWASLILLVTSCLLLWSILAVVVWRGQPQAAAIGFALFATVYLLGLWSLGNAFPVTQFLHQARPQDMRATERLAGIESTVANLYAERDMGKPESLQYRRANQSIERFNQILRQYRAGGAFIQSGHAIVMLLFALFGRCCGAVVYAKRDVAPPDDLAATEKE